MTGSIRFLDRITHHGVKIDNTNISYPEPVYDCVEYCNSSFSDYENNLCVKECPASKPFYNQEYRIGINGTNFSEMVCGDCKYFYFDGRKMKGAFECVETYAECVANN